MYGAAKRTGSGCSDGGTFAPSKSCISDLDLGCRAPHGARGLKETRKEVGVSAPPDHFDQTGYPRQRDGSTEEQNRFCSFYCC